MRACLRRPVKSGRHRCHCRPHRRGSHGAAFLRLLRPHHRARPACRWLFIFLRLHRPSRPRRCQLLWDCPNRTSRSKTASRHHCMDIQHPSPWPAPQAGPRARPLQVREHHLASLAHRLALLRARHPSRPTRHLRGRKFTRHTCA